MRGDSVATITALAFITAHWIRAAAFPTGVLVYPRIMSTDLDRLRLLAIVGEAEIMGKHGQDLLGLRHLW
jgi:hypothetical protein